MKHDLIITGEPTSVQTNKANGKTVIQQPICGGDPVMGI